jgi:hypothetical protein
VNELVAVASNPDALRVLQQTRTLLEQRQTMATTATIVTP